MVPVGGYYTIGAAEAKTVVEQLMPAVVLPMHYKQAGFTPDNLPIAPVNDFLRILGWPVTELQELSLTPYALSGHKVVKLNISK